MKNILFIALAVLPATSVAAENNNNWRGSVGLAAVYSPAFLGSDDYQTQLLPDVRLYYKDDFFASVPEGIGYNVINANGWKAGPIAKIRFERSEDDGSSIFSLSDDTEDLQGLGDVDTAYEVGGFLQYTHNNHYRGRAEVRQGFGGHDGVVADLSADYLGMQGRTRYSFGPRATLASEGYTNEYFGIDATQSANSGLPVYNAGGGLVSYGLGSAAIMPVSEKINATLFASYDRLTGDVADSPLVDTRGSANQFTIGLGLGYDFSF